MKESTFIGVSTKLRKATISVVKSVRVNTARRKGPTPTLVLRQNEKHTNRRESTSPTTRKLKIH
jgi:hypothetical protein